jgi:hypothetical protein
MHDAGILSPLEYASALRDISASTGEARAAGAGTLVIGKWATTLYGFVEGDAIYDSTQSFGDLAGNGPVLRPSGSMAPNVSPISGVQPGTAQPVQPTQGYLGSHGQLQFSVRNSRLGLRVHVPGTDVVRTSAMVEMDFLGSQPSGTAASSMFNSPTMRLRHAMFRVETPVVDFLVGQYWHLFGWQEAYMPNTTEIQGVPGQLYSRAMQVRVSKALRWPGASLEMAIAASRPPALSEVPEGEAGIRFAFNHWTGMHTAGATGTSIAPASVAVTGDVRYFQIPEAASVVPTAMVRTPAGSANVSLLLPVIPAGEDHRGNALTIIGQGVYGNGIGDLYANMNSGVMFPFVPDALGVYPPWQANIDQGLVTYDLGEFALHPVQWSSLLVGLEYYLPGCDGKVWVSGNYSHIESSNSSQFARDNGTPPNPTGYFYLTSQAQVRSSEDWWDANLFFDPVTSVRLGVEFAGFYDQYVDGFTATNYRAQASGFFIF